MKAKRRKKKTAEVILDKIFGDPYELTIDPGLQGTGWAVWRWKDKERLCPPDSCGVLLCPNKGDKWYDRCQWYYNELRKIYIHWFCWGVSVEWPNYRATATGQMVAAKGDLGKLFAISTTALCVAWHNEGFGLPVPVREWKGDLPKSVVAKRIKKKIGKEAKDGSKIESHAEDAVGLGLFRKGFF